MTKTFVLALAVGAAAAAAAQEPAPSAAPVAVSAPARCAARPAAGGMTRATRIAVIDIGQISSQSALGKSYATKIEYIEKQIQTEGTKKQAGLAKLDAAIKPLQEE